MPVSDALKLAAELTDVEKREFEFESERNKAWAEFAAALAKGVKAQIAASRG